MTKTIVDSAQCTNMADVRASVDAVDKELVLLLSKRFSYMDAAARIKNERSAVRDDLRKADVLAKISTLAQASGVPVSVAVDIWEVLVEGSIAYELEQWDRLRG
jgi:isochorismate pyruvate lyase